MWKALLKSVSPEKPLNESQVRAGRAGDIKYGNIRERYHMGGVPESAFNLNCFDYFRRNA